jgi:hypothetical protein
MARFEATEKSQECRSHRNKLKHIRGPPFRYSKTRQYLPNTQAYFSEFPEQGLERVSLIELRAA